MLFSLSSLSRYVQAFSSFVTKLGEAAEQGAAKLARSRAAASAAQAMAERGGVAGKAADANGLGAVFEKRSSVVRAWTCGPIDSCLL